MWYMAEMSYKPKREFRSISEFIEFYFRFRDKVMRGDIPVSKEISDQLNDFNKIVMELDSTVSS